MPVPGSLLERAQIAILESYNHDTLRQSLVIGLNLDLNVIVAQGPFESQVFDLLLCAKQNGRLAELLCRLAQDRPNNTELADLCSELSKPAEDRTPPPSVETKGKFHISRPVGFGVLAAFAICMLVVGIVVPFPDVAHFLPIALREPQPTPTTQLAAAIPTPSPSATPQLQCPNIQIDPCLELDLATGLGQKKCPLPDDNMIVLSRADIQNRKNLAGKALVTNGEGCTCQWVGREIQKGSDPKAMPLLSLNDCSFSIDLEERVTGLLLELRTGGEPKYFSIHIEQ